MFPSNYKNQDLPYLEESPIETRQLKPFLCLWRYSTARLLHVVIHPWWDSSTLLHCFLHWVCHLFLLFSLNCRVSVACIFCCVLLGLQHVCYWFLGSMESQNHVFGFSGTHNYFFGFDGMQNSRFEIQFNPELWFIEPNIDNFTYLFLLWITSI